MKVNRKVFKAYYGVAGILGPAPTIPMSPLMDINLQLGLLSVIVLDMREKGTYNGEVRTVLSRTTVIYSMLKVQAVGLLFCQFLHCQSHSLC